MVNNNFLIQNQNKNAIISPSGELYSYHQLLNFSKELYKKINHRCLVFCLCENSIGSVGGYISFLTKWGRSGYD